MPRRSVLCGPGRSWDRIGLVLEVSRGIETNGLRIRRDDLSTLQLFDVAPDCLHLAVGLATEIYQRKQPLRHQYQRSTPQVRLNVVGSPHMDGVSDSHHDEQVRADNHRRSKHRTS